MKTISYVVGTYKSRHVSLRHFRGIAGLNQTDVAARARISRTQVSLAENGLCSVATSTERKIRIAIVAIAKERLAALLQSDPQQFAIDRALYIALDESRLDRRVLKVAAAAAVRCGIA